MEFIETETETVSGNNLIPETTYEPVTPLSFTSDSGDDISQICSYLEQILSEAFRKNDILDHISESLDSLNDYISAEDTEEAVSDTLLTDEGEAGTDSYQESVTEMLEEMNASLARLEDAGQEISNTVSGNSLHIAGTDATLSSLSEAYTEASDGRAYHDKYDLSLSVCILFVLACIAGIHIAKSVWEKTR